MRSAWPLLMELVRPRRGKLALGFGLMVINKVAGLRSEERRVGKECRSRWSPYH